jgi:hypothetical protein
MHGLGRWQRNWFAEGSLEARKRMQAAQHVLSTFEPEDFPTADEQRALLASWPQPLPTSTSTPRARRRRR